MAKDFHRLPIRYPAKYDYGSRRGYPTLALVYHMAEGTNVARYLSSGNIGRGVSVHYTIEQKTSLFADGEIVRILPEARISGSINPDTIRRTNDPDGFFGVKHNKHALGRWWTNPNVAVVTVEVAGRALVGPTEKQVASMVELFEDVDRRYGRVIPLGHRDFQQVKPCPGKRPSMKRAYREMGGHGKDFDTRTERRYMSTRGFIPGTICDVAPDSNLFNYPGGKPIAKTEQDDDPRYLLGYSPNGRDYALVTSDYRGEGRTAWVKADRVANARAEEPPTTDRYIEGRVGGLEDAEAAVQAVPRA